MWDFQQEHEPPPTLLALGLADLGLQGVAGLLCVAQQHSRVGLVEDGVVHSCVSDAQRTFHHNHLVRRSDDFKKWRVTSCECITCIYSLPCPLQEVLEDPESILVCIRRHISVTLQSKMQMEGGKWFSRRRSLTNAHFADVLHHLCLLQQIQLTNQQEFLNQMLTTVWPLHRNLPYVALVNKH